MTDTKEYTSTETGEVRAEDSDPYARFLNDPVPYDQQPDRYDEFSDDGGVFIIAYMLVSVLIFLVAVLFIVKV